MFNNNNKYSKISLKQSTLEGEPPKKKLFTDADLHMKKLVEKQSNKSTNLQRELLRKSQFETSRQCESLLNYKSGSNTLKDFLKATSNSEQINHLKSLGLLDEDVKLFNSYKSGTLDEKYPNLNDSVLLERLKYIENKIKEGTNNELHCEKLPHPMDDLKSIESKLKDEISPIKIDQIRRKARKLERRSEKSKDTSETERDITDVQNVSYSLATHSKWDKKEHVEFFAEKPKVYKCEQQNYYTIKNGEIIKITPQNEHEQEKQLTLEELRHLPKFREYEPGKHSKTLFVKNLPNKVDEIELKCLFKEFSNDEVKSIQVMTGRMRGQAFVECKDEETAGKLLREINGRILKNKPIVVQYGWKK